MSPATKPQLLQKLHQLHELALSDPETAHSQADDHRVRYVNDPLTSQRSSRGVRSTTEAATRRETGICRLSCLSVMGCK